MKKIVKLTESDLLNIIKKVVSETNIVKDNIKHSPYNPKMESEEIDEESDKRKYDCCKRDICKNGQTCSACRCVDLSKSRQLNKPKMESKEMDEEWGSADEADRYNCCRKHRPCHGGMCVNCRCVPKIKV